MANLPENPTWETGIYQLETDDPVQGGIDGVDNIQGKQLANRTAYLKQQLEAQATQSTQALANHVSATDPHPQYTTAAELEARVAALVASSPAALDTLNELATALGNDPNFATTITNALAKKTPIIETDTTLTVGIGKQFASIQAALDSLWGKTIARTVTIQVDSGTYEQNGELYVGGFSLLRCTLRIVGNIANPSACVLKNTATGWQSVVTFDRVRNVEFSGFKIIAKQTDSHNAQVGINIGNNSHVYSADNSIIVENAWRGVGVYTQSRARFSGIRVANHTEWGIVVGSQSEGDFANATVNGRGRETPLILPAAGIFPDGLNCATRGILAGDEGMLWCRKALVNNCVHGFLADSNATLWANAAKADMCVHGFQGTCGAKMISDTWGVSPTHPVAERATATNCYIGFIAEWNGQVHAGEASAQNCRDYGFAAHWGGVLNAGGSIVNGSGLCYRADMNGTIDAWGHQQSGNTAFAWANNGGIITTHNA